MLCQFIAKTEYHAVITCLGFFCGIANKKCRPQKIGIKQNDLLIKPLVRNQRVMSDNDLITPTAKRGEK